MFIYFIIYLLSKVLKIPIIISVIKPLDPSAKISLGLKKITTKNFVRK